MGTEFPVNPSVRNEIETMEIDERDMVMLQIQPMRQESEDTSEINGGPPKRGPSKACYRLTCMWCVLMAGALVIGALEIYRLRRDSDRDQEPLGTGSASQTSALTEHGSTTGQMSLTIGLNEIDIRINPATSECPSKHCNRCQTRIPKATITTPKPRHCEDQNVISLLRGAGCQNNTYDWVKSHMDSTTNLLPCDEYDVPVTCCFLKQLMTMEGTCRGNLVCNNLEPDCRCPPGTKNPPLCQEKDDETVVCKCFNETLKLCGEESMPDCSNTSRPADWSECHMGGQTAGQNCVCKPARSSSEEEDSDDLDMCATSRSFQQNLSNGSERTLTVSGVLVTCLGMYQISESTYLCGKT